MIVGDILLSLSLAAVLAACWFYYLAARGQRGVIHHARWSSRALAILVSLASVYLMSLLLGDEFRVEYVWANSSSTLPVFYKFSAFWGGQEGSILLWLLFGTLYVWAMSAQLQRESTAYEPHTMLVMSAIQLFLLVLLVLDSPFHTMPGVPFEGRGLNPLLQDPYMVVHPPILFLGFAGMSTTFAFAMAALWKRDYRGWAVLAWPWTLVGWGFLGLGLSIGGFWAYRVLGWGGYWGWDPVENSSLVPWLLGAGLVHGLMAQKSRGRLFRWNIFLALAAYASIIYSTFLTRSGVLSDFSVHTFGASPLWPVMVVGVTLFVAIPLILFLRRYKEIPAGSDEFKSLLSRDFTGVAAIVTFIFCALAVSVGTSSPIITGITSGSGLLCGSSGLLMGLGGNLCQQSNVATSYYTTTSAPLGLILAALMAFAPVLAWQQSNVRKVVQLLTWPFLVAVLGTFFAAVVMMRQPGSLLAVFVALFAVGANVVMIARIVRANVWKIGGYLAHVGVALALVGIIGTTAYKQVEQMQLIEGRPTQALGYTFRFQGLEQIAENKWAVHILVQRGEETFLATPKLIPTDEGMVRNPYIRKYPTEDLYISPGDYEPGRPAGHILELAKGQSAEAEGYSFRFVDYVRTGHDQQSGGVISVGAVLEVTKAGATTVITPTVVADPQKGLVQTPVTIPGTTIEVALDTPNVGHATISVLDITKSGQAMPAFMTVEVSREPGINLLWLGLLVIAAGSAIAAVRRRIEGQRAVLAAHTTVRAHKVPPAQAKGRRQRRRGHYVKLPR